MNNKTTLKIVGKKITKTIVENRILIGYFMAKDKNNVHKCCDLISKGVSNRIGIAKHVFFSPHLILFFFFIMLC